MLTELSFGAYPNLQLSPILASRSFSLSATTNRSNQLLDIMFCELVLSASADFGLQESGALLQLRTVERKTLVSVDICDCKTPVLSRVRTLTLIEVIN